MLQFNFLYYYNVENKTKIAIKPDQDLPVGPLCSVAFTIPQALGISLKIMQKWASKKAQTKALNLAWVKKS